MGRLVGIVPCRFPMPNQEGTTTDTSQLLTEAQAAYEHKRLRECIALTKELIAMEPGNTGAQALQQAIRDDIQQDVHDARTLIEQSGTADEKKKYRKAAEIILIKAVQLDPDNAEAKALLQSARAVPGVQVPNPPQPPPQPQPPAQPQAQAPVQPQAQPPAQPQPQPHHAPQHQSQPVREELSFTAAPVLFKSIGKEKKKSGLKIPLGLILTLLGGGAVLKFVQSHQPSRTTLAATSERTETSTHGGLQPVSTKTADAASLIPSTIPSSTPAPLVPPALTGTSAQPPAAPSTAPSVPAAATPAPATPAAVVPAIGSLAVSSPTAAEIFQNGKHVGSTPTTLQLPAGRQALEYRHGDLKTVVNHDIKANETTTASVTFQINVQINAKPWAQVFLDGAARRPLGQTPLSSVSVPIGGVLMFENPNFATKSYRITEKDTAIQVDFQ